MVFYIPPSTECGLFKCESVVLYTPRLNEQVLGKP